MECRSEGPGVPQALTYDVRKGREREVVAFMQSGAATRIQAAVRGWQARRLVAGGVLLARCVGAHSEPELASGSNGRAGAKGGTLAGPCAGLHGRSPDQVLRQSRGARTSVSQSMPRLGYSDLPAAAHEGYCAASCSHRPGAELPGTCASCRGVSQTGRSAAGLMCAVRSTPGSYRAAGQGTPCWQGRAAPPPQPAEGGGRERWQAQPAAAPAVQPLVCRGLAGPQRPQQAQRCQQHGALPLRQHGAAATAAVSPWHSCSAAACSCVKLHPAAVLHACSCCNASEAQ